MPGDGVFHLSVPIATLWIAQLAIIHGCVDNELPRKAGEVFLREFNLQCRRTVTKTEAIVIDLQLEHKRQVGEAVYYSGSLDVDNGAFVGSGKFIARVYRGAHSMSAGRREWEVWHGSGEGFGGSYELLTMGIGTAWGSGNSSRSRIHWMKS